MKKFLLLLSVVALTFTGCYEEELGPDVPDTGTLEVQPSYIMLGSGAHEEWIDIYTNYAWRAQSSADWIVLGTTEGVGAASICINIPKNDTSYYRTGYITVFCDDYNLMAEVYIEQEAGENTDANEWTLLTPAYSGKFRGNDLLAALFNIDPSTEIDVNIYEHNTRKGYYKIEDPWALSIALGFGYSSLAEAEADGLAVTHADFLIDASNPNEVVFEQQSLGVDIGYGDIYVESGYPRYIDAVAGAGKLEDGVITFPTKGCIIAMPGYNNSAYYANINGMFRIVLPGYRALDYSFDVNVSIHDTTKAALLDFMYGADVTGIKYMLVGGNQESNASGLVSTLVAGTDSNILTVENFEKGKGEVVVEVNLQPAVYTIVAAPADQNGVLRDAEAVVRSFYHAGSGNENHPCELSVLTARFSEIFPEYAADYPDHSAFAYGIFGTDIKSAKYLVEHTATFDYYAHELGVDPLTLVTTYGKDISLDNLARVNSENGLVNGVIGLDPATEYTIGVYAVNNYDESIFVTATYTTDPAPQSSTGLVTGQYYMSCNVELQSSTILCENTFTVEPNGNDGISFLVSDLGVNDGGQHKFHAVYDSTANTLTVDGTYYGAESSGSLFGAVLYGQAGDDFYTIFSYNSEESKGKDPIIFGVDPPTKQISSLQTMEFDVAVYDANYKYLGFFNIFYGAGTTIEYYGEVATRKLKSTIPLVKDASPMVRVPFSSIKVDKSIVGSNRGLKQFKQVNFNGANTASAFKRTIKSVMPSSVRSYTPAKTKGITGIKANAEAISILRK